MLLSSSNLDASVMYAVLMEKFLSAVKGKTEPLLDGRTAMLELSVALALKKAAEQGKSIKLFTDGLQ